MKGCKNLELLFLKQCYGSVSFKSGSRYSDSFHFDLDPDTLADPFYGNNGSRSHLKRYQKYWKHYLSHLCVFLFYIWCYFYFILFYVNFPWFWLIFCYPDLVHEANCIRIYNTVLKQFLNRGSCFYDYPCLMFSKW